MQALFQELLLAALNTQKKSRTFAEVATHFYNSWYKNQGTSYFILFKKNLRITNLQFAELISLLRCHIYSRADSTFGDPLFVNADEIKHFITELFSATIDIKKKYTISDVEQIALLHTNIVERTVTLNPYYGSCTIYLPPNLDIRLDKVCAESGYIHSVGRLVYVRNMTKATEPELVFAIKQHLGKYPPPSKIPALFRTYSHEDFTRWDRSVGVDGIADVDWTKVTFAPDLTHGLDEVKIHTRKAHFKKNNIIELLRSLKNQFDGTLDIPEPGSYKKSLDVFKAKHGKPPERTLFLVNDAAASQDLKYPSSKKYYICYDQLWFNTDPFSTFDEDKPGWTSHTTIPHSLAAAMVNITRPWRKKKLDLIDPFGGSGTILLECLRRVGIQATSSDNSEMANIVAQDNILFFQKPVAEIVRLRDLLLKYADPSVLISALGATGGTKELHRDFLSARAALEASLPNAQSSNVAPNSAHLLVNLSFEQRLFFYVLLRTRMRHVAELAEERNEWHVAFRHELLNLVIRLNSHKEFLEFSKTKKLTKNKIPFAAGDYSAACWLNPLGLKSNSRGSPVLRKDATELKKESYDLILTDPPYGFNTKEKDIELMKLYRDFIWCAVSALRDGGQLVICCPHYSYSGRHIPIFIRPEFVTQQILLAARDNNKAVRSEQFSLPAELHQLSPPYYWEAPTALQRSILHFHFRSL